MSSWELLVYQKVGDDLVETWPAPNITFKLVRRLWCLPAGDPGLDSYPITGHNIEALRPLIETPLDLAHFDYFIEQVDGRDSVRAGRR